MNTTRASLRSDLTLLTQLGFLEARPRVGYYYNQSRQGYDIYMKMIQMSVADYQSMPVVVNDKASAYDALVSLFINNIGTLFIVNENKSKGIFYHTRRRGNIGSGSLADGDNVSGGQKLHGFPERTSSHIQALRENGFIGEFVSRLQIFL